MKPTRALAIVLLALLFTWVGQVALGYFQVGNLEPVINEERQTYPIRQHPPASLKPGPEFSLRKVALSATVFPSVVRLALQTSPVDGDLDVLCLAIISSGSLP